MECVPTPPPEEEFNDLKTRFKLIKSTKHVYKIRTIDTDTLIKNISWCKNQITLLKKDIKSYINTYNLLTNNSIDTIVYADNGTLDNCNYIISIAHNKYYNYKAIGHKAVNNRYVFNTNKQFNNNTDISISYDTDILNTDYLTYTYNDKSDNRTKTVNNYNTDYSNYNQNPIQLSDPTCYKAAASWKYEDNVIYPFGYGDSIADFTYSNFDVKEENDQFKISVDVKNTGKRGILTTLLLKL